MQPYNPYSDDYENYYHGAPPTNKEYLNMMYYLDMKNRIIEERRY